MCSLEKAIAVYELREREVLEAEARKECARLNLEAVRAAMEKKPEVAE